MRTALRTGVPGIPWGTRSLFRWCLVVLTFVLQLHAAASGPFLPPGGDTLHLMGAVPANEEVAQDRDPRATPVLLAVLLGPFGAHRLHLGTSPKVVIIYGATLGGFGILPLIDLGHLLFAKDQQRFRDNDKLLMWR